MGPVVSTKLFVVGKLFYPGQNIHWMYCISQPYVLLNPAYFVAVFVSCVGSREKDWTYVTAGNLQRVPNIVMRYKIYCNQTVKA